MLIKLIPFDSLLFIGNIFNFHHNPLKVSLKIWSVFHSLVVSGDSILSCIPNLLNYFKLWFMGIVDFMEIFSQNFYTWLNIFNSINCHVSPRGANLSRSHASRCYLSIVEIFVMISTIQFHAICYISLWLQLVMIYRYHLSFVEDLVIENWSKKYQFYADWS